MLLVVRPHLRRRLLLALEVGQLQQTGLVLELPPLNVRRLRERAAQIKGLELGKK